MEPYGEVICSHNGFPEGTAIYNQMPIRQGLTMTVDRFCGPWHMEMDFEIAGAPIEFEYWLSGSGRCDIKGMGPSPSVFLSEAGTMSVRYTPDVSGRCTSSCASEMCIVGLQVDPTLFHALLGDTVAYLPDEFKLPIEGGAGDKFALKENLSPAVLSVCHQLLTCPFTGKTRDLFMESKALELLCLQTNALASSSCDEARALTRREINRIHEARDCLVADLKNPPNLGLLSRQTGINETRLKTSFRTVFGVTMFEYLRRHKMEVARTWLEDGAKNVSESAYDVGYANVSHFIRAFRGIFGVTPGEVAARNRTVL